MDDNDNNEKLNGFIKFSTIKESLLKQHGKKYNKGILIETTWKKIY